ncbi:hypothetical protein SMTE4_17650 [Serratia marcescens]|jgi:hypothetical protein|nr:hypothetical protein SMWW4_v1c24580 [Serratia marcescens WW4]ERH74262.1 hypothetical protein N040_00235 [Serratia marcescens EGD-HP20]CAI1581964.1 Uncharacterised protein [Serratia marcescens]BEN44827.1 hypothetical protein SMKC056_17730 [Serratia marcescens]BEO13720.1 hypothetical protein SMQC17_17500 [Serratia marcescens]
MLTEKDLLLIKTTTMTDTQVGKGDGWTTSKS